MRKIDYNKYMDIQASVSEDHGIALLTTRDTRVYSIGISTGGVAEIRMAQAEPRRHVIATTIDTKGIKFAKEYIAENHFDGQIEAKIEDVAEPLPYADRYFDYIYARLVLHYLSKDKLPAALAELYRVLKPGGTLFVVVRSTECPDARRQDAQYDPATSLTAYTFTNENSGEIFTHRRYFHTEQSISHYLTQAGFDIAHVTSYDEHLYVDFMRTIPSPRTDNVIEVLAAKP